MEKIFVKPAVAGQLIRHPEKLSHAISAGGEWVVNSVLWQRKIMLGEVVIAEPQEVKQEVKAVKKLNKEGDE